MIDYGKAISELFTNSGNICEYLEVIGSRNPLLNNPSPFVFVPITAGMGAEVTRNAVIDSPDLKE